MPENSKSSFKELLLALLIGAGAFVLAYVIPFLVLLGLLSLFTDWDFFMRLIVSFFCTGGLVSVLDMFTDYKDWWRRKLVLKNWDERRKAKTR